MSSASGNLSDTVVLASKIAIEEALLIFQQQATRCGWNRLNIYPISKIMIERHFLLGIIDALTTDWDTPIQPPDRAFMVFILYLSEHEKIRRMRSVLRIIKYLRHQQDRGQGFAWDVFLCGQHASTNIEALSYIIDDAVQAGRRSEKVVNKARKRSLITTSSVLGSVIK